MDRVQELRKLYGRLKAMLRQTPLSGLVSSIFLSDYNHIVRGIASHIDDDLSHFSSNDFRVYGSRTETPSYYAEEIRLRISQLIGILEHGYNIDDRSLEIGSLYNAIKDNELRDRCGDLLTANGHFDRVISQASLVLEDRVRRKSGFDRSLYGTGLINAAIKANPSESPIVFSTTPSEQEGYANIVRGLMLALRNETNHNIMHGFTREDALSICGFIDRILRLIDQA